MGYMDHEEHEVVETAISCDGGKFRCGGRSFDGSLSIEEVREINPQAAGDVGQLCDCGKPMSLTVVRWTGVQKIPVCECGKRGGALVLERESLGIYAGLYCDPCWAASGYRKEGREGFDPTYAGESYEGEDYV